MAEAGVFTPYSTVSGFVNAYPGWIPALDKERIASYQTYEEIYWNHPETFKLVVRGTEDRPIYIPSGRIIVETMNRYVAKKFGFMINPAPGTTAGAEQQLAQQVMDDFFIREAMRSKFSSNKRYGIMRGDWVFHIVANPLKPEGSRVSIRAIDPGSWFPVYDDDDLDKLIKVHIAEVFLDNEGKEWIKRQTYERAAPDSTQILVSIAIYELDKAFAVDGKPEAFVLPPTPLPPEITAFPVYPIKNFDQPANPFGSSEMRGLERLMAAINQSASDEDISLALEGLGVYATDGAGPVDDEGNPVDWIIGPGRVVENAAGFKRINGVGSISPYTEHMGTLWSFMKQAGGTPDSAIGKVDVQVAESGVALALDLAPILAKAEEKDDLIIDVTSHMLYDLRIWFKIYERWNLDNTRIVPTFGDKLPQNRKAEVDLASALVTAKIMSTTTAREYLKKFGFEFAENEAELLSGEAASEAASVDPFGARLASESEGTTAPTATTEA